MTPLIIVLNVELNMISRAVNFGLDEMTNNHFQWPNEESGQFIIC